MTKEEKTLAYSMRLDGATIRSIADKFGVSPEYIRKIVDGALHGRSYVGHVNSCIYPNIRKWMVDNKLTYNGFSSLLSMDQNTIRKFLVGKGGAYKSTIDKILETTGMTYEVAFALDTTQGKTNA